MSASEDTGREKPGRKVNFGQLPVMVTGQTDFSLVTLCFAE